MKINKGQKLKNYAGKSYHSYTMHSYPLMKFQVDPSNTFCDKLRTKSMKNKKRR
jgi:hypothetical protein